jgi:hypothetical protein
MTKKPKTPQPEPVVHRWTIYRVRGTPAAAVGTVEAPDEGAAIAKAIEEFAIEPQHRDRLIEVRRS